MEHKLELAQQTPEYAEFKCPACPRRIRLGKSGLQIVKRGDQRINHGSASIGGLNIGTMVEWQATDEPWRSDSSVDAEPWQSGSETDEPWQADTSDDPEPWRS